MHQEESLRLYLTVDDSLKSFSVGLFAGQKHHPYAVAAFLGHRNTVEKYVLMGNLHHDASTIPREVVGSFRTSVRHIFEHFKSLVNNRMMFAAIYLNHKSYATAVVLVIGRI